MRLPLLITAFSLLTFSAGAQVFQPGILVTPAGDTLRGEIENSFWETVPATVRFRPEAGTPPVTYAPPQLRAFQLVGGRYFRTELLTIDQRAETRTGYLPRGLAFSPLAETVFAEVLVEGPAPLLRVVRPGATHYFVRRENQPYIELTERKYLQPNREGQQVIVDGNTYRIQLTQLFGECAAATQLIPKADFTAQSLTAIVQAYNLNCSASAQAGQAFLPEVAPRRALAWHAGVLAGAQLQSLELNSSPNSDVQGGTRTRQETPLLDGVKVASGLHPVAGLYADLLLPNRKLALHGELMMSTVGKSGTLPAQGTTPAAEYRWKGGLLTGHLGLRYFLPLGARHRLFLGIGLPIDWSWLSESSLRYGDGQPRQAEGFTIPKSDSFLRFKDGSDFVMFFPYAEVGFRRGAFTVTADMRLVGANYTDRMTIQQTHRDNQGRPVYLEFTPYTGTMLISNFTVGYRLTRDRDAAAGR